MFPIVIFLFSLFIPQFTIAQDKLINHLTADPNGVYHIYWLADKLNLTVEIQVKTKGYVGFGFSPNGGMIGADVVIGWVLPNGKCVFHDRHALAFEEPIRDIKQNYHVLKCSENETHTIIRFTRELNTCDKEDIKITDDTLKLIYAWHPEDPKDITGLPPHGKTRRGTRDILVISPQPQAPDLTDDIITWEIHMPNVTIPAEITTYWCIFAEVPDYDVQHDYIGFDIKVTPGNEHLVHHFALFECRGDPALIADKMAMKGGYKCLTVGTLAPPPECQPPMIVWLVGSQGQRLPQGVGIPVGRKYGGASHYQLQIHYNNMDKTPGVVDSTSLNLYLSKNKRPKQGATLQVYGNIDYTFVIPPNQPEFPIASFCPPECTQQSIPPEGITVFAVGLHAHLTARNISMRHFRNNTELKPIAVDNNYQFGYQATRQLTEYVQIIPGDTLMATCTYTSKGRNTTLVGGYGTESEMCFIYMSYFPKMNLSLCIGGPKSEVIFDYFGVKKLQEDMVHIELPISLQNKSMFVYEEEYDWSKVDDAKLKKMYNIQNTYPKSIYCQHVPEAAKQDRFVEYQFPANTVLLPPKVDQCAAKSIPPQVYPPKENPYEEKTTTTTEKSYY